MLKLRRGSSSLKVVVTDEYNASTTTDISGFLAIGQEVDTFLEPILEHLSVMAPKSAQTYALVISEIGDALSYYNIHNLPATEVGWQELILGIHRFIHARTDSKAGVGKRMATWEQVRRLLAVAMDEGQIPISVFLPAAPTLRSLDSVDISSYQARLIGQQPAEVITEPPLDIKHKLLTTTHYKLTDAQALEKIRDDLSRKRTVLFNVLKSHWDMIKKNYEFGKQLLASVNWDELKARIEAGPLLSHDLRRKNQQKKYWGAGEHPAHFRNGVQGLANYLAICRHTFGGYILSTQAAYRNKDCRMPDFDWQAANDLIFSLPEAPPNFGHLRISDKLNFERTHALNWMLGNLRGVDIGAIAALLTMLNPKFTPESLLLAKVHDKHGKTYLDLEADRITFSIEKKRARAMKTEKLDDLSIEIINTVMEMTSFHRSALRKQKHPGAVLLFLQINKKNQLTLPARTTIANITMAISGSEAGLSPIKSLNDYYPELAANGLGVGAISLSKIRDTEGVLEWFRTGSLKAMAKKLGNTKKVVIEHYLPKSLLDAFNTRLIRRFQTLWIAVAAADEDFLLDVTDCATLADLHVFLLDMLKIHSSTSSPLGGEMHLRFIHLMSDASDQTNASGQEVPIGTLNVAIGVNALTALYLYHQAALNAGLTLEMKNAKDPVTGVAPKHFIDLAQMLLIMLPKDKRIEYQKAHEQALIKAQAHAKRLGWERLLAARS